MVMIVNESAPLSECLTGQILSRRILILQDVIKKGTPFGKKVTSIHTICEAMNSNNFSIASICRGNNID